jgi:hypothetical protein
MDEILDGANIPTDTRAAASAWVKQLLPQAIANGGTEISALANQLFEPLILEMAAVAKKAHTKSLEASFTSNERYIAHKNLRFFVNRVENEHIILPDTCLAVFKKGGISPFSHKGDSIESVILPISSHVVIVGQKKQVFHRNSKTLNRALASCALKNFIAEVEADEFQQLSSRIGRNARIVSDAELNRIVNFDNLLKSVAEKN